MEISEIRKMELKKLDYCGLQSTVEYNYFIRTYVTGQSVLMNSIVEYILKCSYEDVEAPFSYDDYKHNECNIENAKEHLKTELKGETFSNSKTSELLNLLENISDEEELEDFAIDNNLCFDIHDFDEAVEVMQWFLMGDVILHQLQERGEIVLDEKFWGRRCCGQSIEMDGVIIDIFKEWFLK